jgi:hypothetical protein
MVVEIVARPLVAGRMGVGMSDIAETNVHPVVSIDPVLLLAELTAGVWLLSFDSSDRLGDHPVAVAPPFHEVIPKRGDVLFLCCVALPVVSLGSPLDHQVPA